MNKLNFVVKLVECSFNSRICRKTHDLHVDPEYDKTVLRLKYTHYETNRIFYFYF